MALDRHITDPAPPPPLAYLSTDGILSNTRPAGVYSVVAVETPTPESLTELLSRWLLAYGTGCEHGYDAPSADCSCLYCTTHFVVWTHQPI